MKVLYVVLCRDRSALFRSIRLPWKLVPSQVDFTSFRDAARSWLASAAYLDPALAAAADLLDRDPHLEQRTLLALRAQTTDAHALLGAATLLDLLDLLHLSEW